LSDFYAPYYPQYLFNIASQIILPNHDALLYNAFDLKTGDNAFLFVPFKLIPDQPGMVEFSEKRTPPWEGTGSFSALILFSDRFRRSQVITE